MLDKKKNLMIVAGEISGDLYGAALIHTLKEFDQTLDFVCIGSQKMEQETGKLFFDSSSWGVIGMVESLKKLPGLYRVYKKIKQFLIRNKPDLLLLIDYPGFNMRLVHAARKRGVKTIYYIPPSKWAKTPDQIRDAAESIDLIITTFETTYDLYRQAGADVSYVGHPLLDIVKSTKPKDQLKREFGITPENFTIGLLPGSREKEVKYLLPVLLKAARLIKSSIPNAKFIIPITSATFKTSEDMNQEKIEGYIRQNFPEAQLTVDATYNVFSTLDFAVIASGTATLEAACMNIPMIIIYKISLLTELIARLSGKLPIIFGLPNLILGRQVIPEFAQRDANPEKIASEVVNFYRNQERIEQQKNYLKDVLKKMGEAGATERAARLIIDFLRRNDGKS
ncbi:MAG: lipid-A-disaccharide synthase [Candidatus Wallbacteria bacterium]|nr:lipid-A-disaccharide synthase [Candidatus Wallbacteria bacterium]